MGDGTKIQWTEASWNPVRGCSRVSAGCQHCYAETQAARFSGPGQPYEGLIQITSGGPRWNGAVKFVEEHLADPLRWKRPRRIFVNSMSDLFHEALTFEQIAAIFGVMAAARQHTFQVLTKRPARAREWFAWVASRPFEGPPAIPDGPWDPMAVALGYARKADVELPRAPRTAAWPLPNVWLGVSVEDQKSAHERIPLLLGTPAAVRWVSYEPALGPVDFARLAPPGFPHDTFDALRGVYRGGLEAPRLDWIVVGGESGPGARPFDVAWARSTVAACKAAGVPCFVKQVGAYVVDRNDAGFEADTHVWVEGPDTGLPVDAGAWPTPVDVEHDLDGTVDGYQGAPVRVRLKDRKGGDPSEWPTSLRVREFPSTPSRRTS